MAHELPRRIEPSSLILRRAFRRLASISYFASLLRAFSGVRDADITGPFLLPKSRFLPVCLAHARKMFITYTEAAAILDEARPV